MMWGYGFGWGGMLLMLVGTLLFLALLAILIWAMLRFASRNTTPVLPYGNREPVGPSALEILRQRYARGEIDAATYEQMRERLESPRTVPPAGRV
jgi:putative membrane protein